MPTTRKRRTRQAGTGKISRWVKHFIQEGKIPDESDEAAWDEYCYIDLFNGTNVAGFPLRHPDGIYYHDTHPEIERDVLTQQELDNWDPSKDKYSNWFEDGSCMLHMKGR
jgi:hypothetical protein